MRSGVCPPPLPSWAGCSRTSVRPAHTHCTISPVDRLTTDSFRTADKYGQVTRDQLKSYREGIWQAPELTRQPSTLTRIILLCLINGPFFGIPQTYLAHVKSASEFRGHLAGLKESWESYTLQLVREFSDFILIVSYPESSRACWRVELTPCTARQPCCFREPSIR